MLPSQKGLALTPCQLPSNKYALTGIVYVSPGDFQTLKASSSSAKTPSGADYIFVDAKGFVLKCEALDEIEAGQVGLNSFFRQMFNISKLDKLSLGPAVVRQKALLGELELAVEHKVVAKNESQVFDKDGCLKLDEDFIAGCVTRYFQDRFVNTGEKFAFYCLQESVVLICTVKTLAPVDMIKTSFGVLDGSGACDIVAKPVNKAQLKIESARMDEKQIFKKNMNFQELGIGGLDAEFDEIFRRAFNSRRYPQAVIDKYGIQHVKGLLLYGPPGTGKTLIARKISEALNCEKPKIVNGPEIFDKFVGQSEEKIRELFADAEQEAAEKGDESGLHVIIFDEIDAICRKRGAGGGSSTGVNESVVNQLLSKLDGVESGNNVLVIGMTNRKDMIDEAILRPGRLEIHLEIGLPNEHGRRQIFEIHTRDARENGVLAGDVDVTELAQQTKNYTGAEIAAVCRSATSFALYQDIQNDPASAASMKVDKKKSKASKKMELNAVGMKDFVRALTEIKPAFGIDESTLETRVSGGMYNFSKGFANTQQQCRDLIKEIRDSEKTQLLTLLLDGDQGSGKTALAAQLALDSGFPFVKFLSASDLIAMSDFHKIAEIVKVFEDAYKSDLSLIVLDDLERIIEFIQLGPRFNNAILQTLLVLIRRPPPKSGRKLMIVGTVGSASKSWLKDMSIVDAFNVNYHVSTLRTADDFSAVLANFNCTGETAQAIGRELEDTYSGPDSAMTGVSIKNLVLAIEMALSKSSAKAIEQSFLCEAVASLQI